MQGPFRALPIFSGKKSLGTRSLAHVQNNSSVLVESILACFWKKIPTQTARFTWAIDCKMVDFQNGLIFRMSGVVSSGFLHRTTLLFLKNHFLHGFGKKIPTQTAHFAWAIDFAKWLIFKMVSFFEYSVLFPAVFCTEQLCCSCRIILYMVLEKKFQPKLPILHGL